MALEKNLKFYKQIFLLEKGCDFSKSLEPNTVLSLLNIDWDFKIFAKPSKLKGNLMYVHLPEKSALLLRSITAVELCCTVIWN